MGEAPNIAGGTVGNTINYVPLKEIQRIRQKIADKSLRVKILADVFRINALYMIRYTGSGHPGSTFSCMDILTWLWAEEMINTNEKGINNGDIFFSSKGHDVPALYSILIGLKKLPPETINKLRRLGGLPGHPDVNTPYIATNTGSLGMGISKARGMAHAKRLQGKSGRIYVLTGDGELQEGQIWESLQPTVNGKYSEITVIVDHNKIQSDIHVKNTSDLGDLEEKFRAFGWEVARCNGHDFNKLAQVFAHFKTIKDRPQVLIADTLKGAGVSFMTKLGEDGFYKFHSGAPSYEQYQAAVVELSERINKKLKKIGEASLKFESREMPVSLVGQSWERLIPAYSDELVQIARERKNIVAMDADLVLDTGLIPFSQEFPDRYIQCGIAEQDMVSMAGGVALQGLIPVVHSFECFLTTRANEHFYNNATEKTKIIYVGSLAGLLPAMPGHSHQSVRGISILGSIPGLTLIQPGNAQEVRMAIRWAVEKNAQSTYIRFVSVASGASYSLPDGYEFYVGRGAFVHLARTNSNGASDKKDVLLIAYGPVMLTEAVKTTKILEEKGISAAVVDLPWLNRIDEQWLKDLIPAYKLIVTLDDHYVMLGQGMQIASAIARICTSHPKIISLGLTEVPACGHNEEVLKHHRLDYRSLAESIRRALPSL